MEPGPETGGDGMVMAPGPETGGDGMMCGGEEDRCGSGDGDESNKKLLDGEACGDGARITGLGLRV